MPMVKELKQVFKKYEELPDGSKREIIPYTPPVYLLLLSYMGHIEETEWKIFEGRMEGKPVQMQDGSTGYYTDIEGNMRSVREPVFSYLQDLVSQELVNEEQTFIDLSKSYVMTDKQTLHNNVCAYTFMRMCLESDAVIMKTANITLEELNEEIISYGLNPDELWMEDVGRDV